MSFSRDVKEELINHIPKSRHCQIAELSGIVAFGEKVQRSGENTKNILAIADASTVRKYFTLLYKTRNITEDISEYNDEDIIKFAKKAEIPSTLSNFDELILQQPCCKRSYIRGAFLVAGSISDPNKGYHFEIVCKDESEADRLIRNMNFFEVEAKKVRRQEKFVVYLKEGAQIVEILRVMEAPKSVMELENVRVVKEVRGTINRKVNCETANISKTVSAAVKQIEDIRLIDANLGLANLPETLQEIAEIRLANPDTPLQDLGQLLDPPIGKSGVNHRLKRLSAIAETYRV